MGIENISKIVLCHSHRCEYNIEGNCTLNKITISFSSVKEGSFSYCADFKDKKGDNINSYKKWPSHQ
jgi:hypothetical protein